MSDENHLSGVDTTVPSKTIQKRRAMKQGRKSKCKQPAISAVPDDLEMPEEVKGDKQSRPQQQFQK